MDKLKYVKLENEDGSYSDNIPLAVDSDYVSVGENNLTEELSNKANLSTVTTLSNEINVQKTRIDNLATLEDGSTTGDAELIDARIGFNNVSYQNLGEAIRSEATEILKRDNNIDFFNYFYNDSNWEIGGMWIDSGSDSESNKRIRLKTFSLLNIPKGTRISTNNNFNFAIVVAHPDLTNVSENFIVTNAKGLDSVEKDFIMPFTGKARIAIAKSDDSVISSSEIPDLIRQIQWEVPSDITLLSEKIGSLENDYVEIEDIVKSKRIEFFNFIIQGYYTNNAEYPFNGGKNRTRWSSTELIPLQNCISLKYTGCASSSGVAAWYDEDKNLLGRNVPVEGQELNQYECLPYKIDNAVYVGFSSYNGSEDVLINTPIVEATYSNSDIKKYSSNNYLFDIVGDGETDDTDALQSLIDQNTTGTICLEKGIYLISRSLTVDISKIKIFDGNNSKIIVNGDFSAFIVTGNLVTGQTANPNGLTEENYKMSNAKFRNLIITATTEEMGTGITLQNCIWTHIENCFIYLMKKGIVLTGTNRDIGIYNNHLFGNSECGLEYTNSSNLHQCNIVGNFISYSRYCVKMESPKQVANYQFCGNDIELGTYPPGVSIEARAIYISIGNTTSAQLSELEFSGNTIQGHGGGDILIELVGQHSKLDIQDVCFTGNHISNSKLNAFRLVDISNITIQGNTYKDIYEHVYQIEGNCSFLNISGNTARRTGGFLKVLADSVLLGCNFSNEQISMVKSRKGIDIQNADLTDVLISTNVLQGNLAEIKILSSVINKVVVSNNLASGEGVYNLNEGIIAYNNN